jgi:hypothetical protein
LVVDKGIPLSEIEKWDLQDINNAYSIMEMQNDYKAASDMYDYIKMKSDS